MPIRKITTPVPGAPVNSRELRRLADIVQRHDSLLPSHGYGSGLEGAQSAAGFALRNNQYVPFWAKIAGVATAALTALNGSLSDSATSLTVSSATGFPAGGTGNFWIRIDDEYLEVTAGHGTTSWTVTRGMLDTTAAAHSSGARVDWAFRPYSWIEQQQDSAGGFVEHAVPRYGIGTAADRTSPAYEVNDNAEIPVDGTAFVQMWLGYDGDYYLFSLQPRPLIVQDTRHCTVLTAAITGTATTLAVAGYGSFPLSGTYTIKIDDEEMTVTAGQGTNSWTVTRAVNSTVATAHREGAYVCQPNAVASTLNGGITSSATSLTVNGLANFPTSGRFYIKIDSEILLVTAGAGTLAWTIERARQNTTAASHSNGAAVKQVLFNEVTGVRRLVFHDDAFVQPGDPAPDTAVHHEVNQPVEVVSSEPDADGFYDGFKLRYNPHTGTFERDCAIWVKGLNE